MRATRATTIQQQVTSLREIQNVEPYRAIRPLELMQVFKSAYGLTESPRLWHLEAKDGMKEVRLNELNAWKSVFIASEKGHSWALRALQVDDGLLVGSDQDPKFVALRERVCSSSTSRNGSC